MNDEQEPKSNPMLRNMAIWSAIIVALLVVASIFNGSSTPTNGITYSSFRDKVEAGEVKSVAVAPDRISGKMQNDETFVTVPLPNDSSLPSLLIEKGVVVEAKAEEQPSLLLILIYQALPFLLILGIAFFVLRQMQKGGGAGGAMGFGKSKAKLLTEKHGKVTFEDVAGIDEAREELQEIVEFLKDPQKFSRLGGKIPRGVLMVGSPGTGKTLLALAAGLHQVADEHLYERLLVTRPVIALGKEIGFLPGTEAEKMEPWLGAITDNLEALHLDDESPHGSVDYILQKVPLQFKSLNYIRGRSFQQSLILIDECQNLTPHQMKTIITRAGSGSKVVCLGNLAQIDTPYLSAPSSGLTYLTERFKDFPQGVHITLQGVPRSVLAEYAEAHM